MARVLVVDDDEPTRQALRALLEDAGHTVTEAPDGSAALDVLRATAERLVVLLDFLLPGQDGAAVLGAVAADQRLASQHTYVLMSASPRVQMPSLEQLRATLGVPLVLKPFDIDVLLDIVDEAARRLSTDG